MNWTAVESSQIEKLKAAIEFDRRALWSVVRAIDEEITGRMWLLEGRGSYAWDDEKYRQEFGWAVHALQEKLEPLRKIAHDLTNCPESEKGVDSVRKMETLLHSAKALVEGMETCHICKGSLLIEDGPAHCEDCSGECDDHDEPACETINLLHARLRKAIASVEV